MMSEHITLSIVTPERIVFEGFVSHIKIPAADGYMGFLPKHAPLISPLGIGTIECMSENGTPLYFFVAGGYIEVHQDKMVVLADVAESSEEIDIERANKARQRALERISDATSGKWVMERAQAALSRAVNRIKTYRKSNG